MGQARQRGPFEERKAQAIAVKGRKSGKTLELVIEQMRIANELITQFSNKTKGMERALARIETRMTEMDDRINALEGGSGDRSHSL